MPVEVVATSLTDGRERWFTYGPVAEAVLASAAMPAIFPPVEIDGGAVHRRRRGRQRPDPTGRSTPARPGSSSCLCNSPVYTPAHVEATDRGHDQRPVHLDPRPLRPGHGPAPRRGRGHPVRRQRGGDPRLRRLLDHRGADRPRAVRRPPRWSGATGSGRPRQDADPGGTRSRTGTADRGRPHPPGTLERSVGPDPFRRVRSGRRPAARRPNPNPVRSGGRPGPARRR